ncbi:MAG: hypothetical protein JNM19_16995 [Chitinophagaceae bacterium]|nr:hypothetical protein [Chitinophagaceae bacterium]
MTWNSIMGFISTIALFLPVLFILALRLGAYRSFPALLLYYTSVFIYNLLTEQYIKASADVVYYWGLANNLMDVPLMLYFLTYFSTSKRFLKRMRLVILSYVVWELAVILVKGLTIDSITIILAPGLPLVFGYCIYFFTRQVKLAIVHRKATGKAMIVSSLLFAYGCYTIIYLMYYVFKAHLDINNEVKQQYVEDTFLVYFMVTFLSSLLISAGIFIERKRIYKLTELKITRKELSDIYPETKRTAPLRTVLLDFDKEHWN